MPTFNAPPVNLFSSQVARMPSKDAFSREAVWTFRSMMEALQVNVLERHDYFDEEAVDAFKATYAGRLTVHTLFDVPHDSDESCSAEVLCLEGTPVLVFQRVGDRSDYSDGLSVVDAKLCSGLLQVLVDYYAKEAFERLTKNHGEILSMGQILASSQYLVPLSDTVFSVGSPKWACAMANLVENHAAWLIEDSGEVVRVEAFGRWLNSTASWEIGKADRNDAVVRTEKGDVTVDCRNLMFTLLGADRAAVQALASAFTAPDHWHVSRVEPVSADCVLVHVSQHHRAHIQSSHACLNFKDSASADIFAAKFSERQTGLFQQDAEDLAPYLSNVNFERSMTMTTS